MCFSVEDLIIFSLLQGRGWKRFPSSIPFLSSDQKPLAHFPLNPGWFIGILVMAYGIIPLKHLGKKTPPFLFQGLQFQANQPFKMLVLFFAGWFIGILLMAHHNSLYINKGV